MTDSNPDQSSLHAAAWKRSSRSANGPHPQCVEVAAITDQIGLRDSKCHRLGTLTISATEWQSLVGMLRD